MIAIGELKWRVLLPRAAGLTAQPVPSPATSRDATCCCLGRSRVAAARFVAGGTLLHRPGQI